MADDESYYSQEDEAEDYIYEDDDDDDDDDDIHDENDREKADQNEDNFHGKQLESKDQFISSIDHKCQTTSITKLTSGSGSSDKKINPNFGLNIPNDGFVMLDSVDIERIMKRLIDDVTNLLDLSYDVVQSLLQNNKWNKEKLIELFFSDPEKVMKNAGIDLYSSSIIEQFVIDISTKNDSNVLSDDPTFQCRICYDTVRVKYVCSLGCNHRFCRPCYSEYLGNQIKDGPLCIIAKCPEFKCTQIVTERVYRELVSPYSKQNYDRYLLRNFIETYKNLKSCPAPNCDKVACGSGITLVKCTCGYSFCFRCHEEAHDPCSCSHLIEWMQKCQNESETANWILANTRKCPACNARIEKNQGCNHMTCRHCKHEFCWMCMGTWAEHGQTTGGFYKCNRFVPTEEKFVEKAKVELERYLHYYQRYHGHDSALKFASKQRELAEQRMLEQQESSKSSWIDVQFLKQATEQVIECRRVLKYTYVLGYFLKDKSTEKQLFEHHQEMLEKNTERLQEYTEKPLEQIDRTQVVNFTRVTEKFMSSLLSNITGGIVSIDNSIGIGSIGIDNTTSFNNNNNNNSSSNNSNHASSAKSPNKKKGK